MDKINNQANFDFDKIRRDLDGAGDCVRIDLTDHLSGPPGFITVEQDNGTVIRISGRTTPDGLHLEIMKMLVDIGVKGIEINSWAWWIAESDKPQSAPVIDHVACHLTSILTGTPEATRGDAFIDMKDAYTSSPPEPDSGIILWHTESTDVLPDTEKKIASGAGCHAATPNLAQCTIAARAYGLTVRASVILV